MDVRGKTVLILGGAGEVGLEVCRLILMEAPKRLIVASSRKETGEAASAKLRAQFPEMASEALTARFITIWLIWTASPLIRSVSGERRIFSRIRFSMV